ncbi:MAG: hypothetical protein ACJ70Z_08900 [Nitrososphaera sp.]
MRVEGRYLIAALSLILIFGGLYFKFLYDVPDGEEATNAWVSWLLVVFGIVGIMASALWKAKNPLEIRSNGNKPSIKKSWKEIADNREDESSKRGAQDA